MIGRGEPPPTFPELFERTVASHPELPAVVAPEGELTYARLARRARRLARRLIAEGVGPEDIVAVVTDRGTGDWLTGLLGVLLAGGAYLALDPNYPAGRVDFMLQDAAPRLVLHPSGVPWETALPHIRIADATADALAGPEDDSAIADRERVSALAADNLAYLVYTSGSTGRPKGVAVPHSGMASLASTQRRVVATGPRDRVLQWASPSFDASFWDITLALLHGATLHLSPSEHLLPGEPLAELLRERGITHATLPPVALGALEADGESLRGATVVSTGDTCTQGLVDQWAVGRRLINGYGPTETTVGATLSAALRAGAPADIGTPFDGARVDVLDGELEPVSPGEVGEFAVAGHGVARGYHGRPRLTADRFRPDPRAAAGERIYLTGDIGLQGTDGRFHFTGRRDDQVKIRGFRIELGEIEAALVRHPQVVAAAVAVRQLQPGRNSVVGWVMTASERADTAGIRRHLAERLPGYMIPAAIVALDRLPTTVNGKIDRDALPLPVRAAGGIRAGLAGDVSSAGAFSADTFSADASSAGVSSADVSSDAPADTPGDVRAEPREGGGLEGTVRALFEEALGASGIGADDNFFELGGDSIRYTRIISTIRRETGVRLPLREAFLRASPRDIARLAERHARPGPERAPADTAQEQEQAQAPAQGA